MDTTPRQPPMFIATASSLLEGTTVYLDAFGRWVDDHQRAHVARTLEQRDALLERAGGDPSNVVEPRLIEVDVGHDGQPHPRNFRERARIRGPSVGRIRGRAR